MTVCKTEQMRDFIPAGQRLMGLDLGKKTIGLATCDGGWQVATPRSILWRRKFGADMTELASILAQEEDIGGLVIGWPVEMDGREGPRCDATRDFAYAMLRWRQETGLPDLPVTFHDERLSTQAVERAMLEADMTRARREVKRDALAAAWILQGFIDRV